MKVTREQRWGLLIVGVLALMAILPLLGCEETNPSTDRAVIKDEMYRISTFVDTVNGVRCYYVNGYRTAAISCVYTYDRPAE